MSEKIEIKNEVPPVYAWKVYKWASKLTSEQDFNLKMYYWTPEAKRLLNRLKYGSGQLIAVIGLQGSGKTALQNALACGLKKSMLLKWTGRKDVFKQMEEYANITSKYFYELLCELDRKMGRRSLLSWIRRNWPDRVHIVKSILEKGVTPNNLGLTLGVDLIDGVMEKAGRKIIDELLISYIGDFRETILIDLPDYSKQNHSEMIKDLREIQKLWEELLLIEAFDINIVLFVQKELFKGHFFYGKADVYEIKPLTPEQLYDFYTKNFAREFIINNQKITYPAPFENEAFCELAKLSRGIFRRFKKYIRICLENWYEELEAQGRWKAPLPLITKDQVLRWIGIEQLEKDMELELMDLFPKSKEKKLFCYPVTLPARARSNRSENAYRSNIWEL